MHATPATGRMSTPTIVLFAVWASVGVLAAAAGLALGEPGLIVIGAAFLVALVVTTLTGRSHGGGKPTRSILVQGIIWGILAVGVVVGGILLAL